MSAKDVQIARFRSRTSEVSGETPLDLYATRVGHLVAILGDGRVGVAVSGVAQPLAARLARWSERRRNSLPLGGDRDSSLVEM